MKGDCKMCGRCCRVSLTTLPDDQWTPETEELLVLKGKQYVDTIQGTRRYVSSAPCPHLDLITDKCTIQGHKPQYCRDYPKDALDLLPGCGYG